MADRTFWSIHNNDQNNVVTPYGDNIGEWYHYTSNVQNYRQLKEGDVVLVRTRYHLLGTGIVHYIEQLSTPPADEGKKQHYRAHYGLTWYEFSKELPLQLIKDAWNPKHRQMSIRRLDEGRILEFVRRYGTWSQLLSLTGTKDVDLTTPEKDNLSGAVTSDEAEAIPGGYVAASVKVRRGQAQFRGALFERYGSACAVTGSCPAHALDAAHLTPYSVRSEHDIEDGLLLRADIHRLFDSYEVGIDTTGKPWKVEMSPKLRRYSAVKELHRKSLSLSEELYPGTKTLVEHLMRCREIWAQEGQG